MAIRDYKKEYHLKQMELDSLLEITQSINNNLSEEALYKIYDFTIRANLNLSRLALFVLEQGWEPKVFFGVEQEILSNTPLPLAFAEANEITTINDQHAPFNQFDVLVPIIHKSRILAIVLAKSKNVGQSMNTTFLQAISNLIIVAIENKRLARRQLVEEALRRELEIAKNVQNFLFPDKLPNGARLKIEASYLPHHNVGGDYYDYIPINKNQFLICIADVSGKGVPAAIMMSNFQASLRTMIRHTSNLTQIVEALNYQIFANAKGEQFITFFGAIYDHELNTMVYVNAGHNPPFLINRDAELSTLDVGTTILGIFDPLPFISEGFISDLDSFTLFAYTDGLTETENEQEIELGSEPIEDYLKANYKKGLNDIHSEIFKIIDEFKGTKPYKDDITILSCKVEAR